MLATSGQQPLLEHFQRSGLKVLMHELNPVFLLQKKQAEKMSIATTTLKKPLKHSRTTAFPEKPALFRDIGHSLSTSF